MLTSRKTSLAVAIMSGPLRVKGCRCNYVGITTGVPQIAADLLHPLSRQGRATTSHSRSAPNAWSEPEETVNKVTAAVAAMRWPNITVQ
jgi:hypothetical protein